MLSQCATEKSHSSGWTSLADTGNYIKQHAPLDLQKKRKRFGHAQLHKIGEASQLFDLRKEDFGNGKQWLYRIKQQPALTYRA